MPKPRKVLFISAPVGAGHIKAAQSIAAAICKKHDHVETKLANIFDFFNAYVGKNILSIYLKILAIFPQLYGMMYGWGNESSLALVGRQIVSRYLAKRMEKYILSYNPDVIVCTHATPAGIVSSLIKDKKLNIPVVVVVTDFVVHRLWVYPEIQHYIVANEKMGEFLNEHGINNNCVKVIGIPVDEKFLELPVKEKVISDLQFSSQVKTILIMGGGAGLLPMDEILLCCENIGISLQIIVVAGNNKDIYKKLKNLQPMLHNKVKVLGYVSYVNELMAISDLIISKPGGMTCAETLCTGIPMLIYRPIPGQEVANTNYLIEHQVALCADSLHDVQAIVKKLFIEQPEELDRLRQNTFKIRRPQAAVAIGDYIFSLAESKT
ncbi:MAG: Monogalactosyldiacylglycerol synthase [Pelosinus sp.]|nr:Monogalactosyldiacylglycerol synthase [Pelosinus sp.]